MDDINDLGWLNNKSKRIELKKRAEYICKHLKKPVQILNHTDPEVQKIKNIPVSWMAALTETTNISQCISTIWEPITKYSQQSIQELIAQTETIFLVVNTNDWEFVGLYYAQQSKVSETISGHLGFPPTQEDDFKIFETQIGQKLPESIKVFSQLHNGLLINARAEDGVKPIAKIYNLGEFLQGIDVTIENDSYDPNQLLAFCGDFAGNEQCFRLDKPLGKDDLYTCDWDHETREVNNLESFWSFLPKVINRLSY